MTRVNVRPEIARAALELAGYRCEKCGCDVSQTNGGCLEVHHVLGRVPTELVNEPENLLVLCKRWGSVPGCHEVWHKHKKQALRWFEEKFGPERLARLRAIQNAP